MKKLFIILSVLCIMTFAKDHSILSQEAESYSNLIHAFENTEATIQETSVHIEFKSPVVADQLQTNLNVNQQDPNITLNRNNDGRVRSIDISIKENNDLTNYQELKKQFQKSNIKFQDFIMITGIYDKKISEKQMQKITNKILEDTDAKFVEGGFIRESFLSTSAYTSQIPTHITTGTNRININIALKYNQSQRMTKLIIATPLIYGDY